MAQGRYGPAGNGATCSRHWKENMHPIHIPTPPARDASSGAFLSDRFGRRVDYLRLSVTDRCNLRCSYCMPAGGIPWVDRAEILSWEEMFRLCLILAEAGVRKIRLTGGEPLVRPGVTSFLAGLRDLPGPPELLLTTNATLLEKHLDELAGAGIARINISLDSLQRDRFRSMTGRDLFDEAWRGIEAAADRGFGLKLNVVVIAGVNDIEIAEFVELTAERDWTVRFIEAMPFDGLGGNPGDLLDGDSIVRRIRERFPIERVVNDRCAVDELYRVPGFAGRIGLIRGHTRSFCGNCSRLRINAAGQMRTCLYAEPSLDLRALLRQGAPSEAIKRRIVETVRDRHWDGWAAQEATEGRDACSMSRIGG
jgi:molybdenum cofactor biosynthesis protein A